MKENQDRYCLIKLEFDDKNYNLTKIIIKTKQVCKTRHYYIV